MRCHHFGHLRLVFIYILKNAKMLKKVILIEGVGYFHRPGPGVANFYSEIGSDFLNHTVEPQTPNAQLCGSFDMASIR